MEINVQSSILNTIKWLIGGFGDDYTSFDTDITTFINSAFSVLNQLGVGPDEGFRINGKEETWSDFLSDEKRFEFVKDYIYISVKLDFDPPTTSSVLEAMKQRKNELEWRLQVAAD